MIAGLVAVPTTIGVIYSISSKNYIRALGFLIATVGIILGLMALGVN